MQKVFLELDPVIDSFDDKIHLDRALRRPQLARFGSLFKYTLFSAEPIHAAHNAKILQKTIHVK
jgi:hypothetical protein